MSDGLSFYGLVNDLEKLRSLYEDAQSQMSRLAIAGRDARCQEIEEHTIKALALYDDLIREYQGKNEQAERVSKYNQEMDEQNRIIFENRDKPWLPFHDGE